MVVARDTHSRGAPATRPQAILVTHAHGDHDGDALKLARWSGASVVATGDHPQAMKIPDAQNLSINIGGVQRVRELEIFAVPAMHSVTPGHAIGYVIRIPDGRTLDHSGDTWVFGDMALIERLFHPAVLLFAMGGGRAGEDPATGALAIREYFHPQAIVPMHIGTLPPPLATAQDAEAAFRGDARFRLLTPGVEATF
jgi:L-ascorbate metabolism protein UlaG (beta-lactamase superfamily)